MTTKQASRVEVDVAPDGKILQTEEKVSVEAVPKVVVEAFTARYRDVKLTEAEKQIKADGSVRYELVFGTGKQRREVTFSESGKFLEKE